MNRTTQFNITLAETKTFLGVTTIVNSRPLYYEYVSKYRRIIVTSETGKNCFNETVECFIIEVSYKGVGLKTWSKTWCNKSDAIAWAKTYAENREINIGGRMTIKEAIGKQLI